MQPASIAGTRTPQVPVLAASRITRTTRLREFFRYHGLWAPGVRLFRRIGFRSKAIVLTIVFLIPISLLSWQYFQDKAATIAFTRAERVGVGLQERAGGDRLGGRGPELFDVAIR